jgi:hypothetical protein
MDENIKDLMNSDMNIVISFDAERLKNKQYPFIMFTVGGDKIYDSFESIPDGFLEKALSIIKIVDGNITSLLLERYEKEMKTKEQLYKEIDELTKPK